MTTWSVGPCKTFDNNPHIMSLWCAGFLVSNDIFCQYHKTKRPHLIPTWSVGPCNFFDDNPHIRSPQCAGVGFLAISFVNITKQWDCTSWRHKAWVPAIFLMIVCKSGHPDVRVFGFLWYILSISHNNESAPHDNMMHRSMLYFWWYSASQVTMRCGFLISCNIIHQNHKAEATPHSNMKRGSMQIFDDRVQVRSSWRVGFWFVPISFIITCSFWSTRVSCWHDPWLSLIQWTTWP